MIEYTENWVDFIPGKHFVYAILIAGTVRTATWTVINKNMNNTN